MSFEFSLAHLTVLHLSPTKMVEVAAKTGYQYVSIRLVPVVGEPIVDLIDNKANLRETLKCLKRENIKVHDVELVKLTPDANPMAFKPLLETGAELGARSVLLQIPDGDRNRAVDHYGQFCDLAASFNLKADLEFIPWIETATLNDAAEIISSVARDNAGLLIDTLHFFRSDSTIEQLRQLPQKWFNFIQLCDARNPAPETIEEIIKVARSDRYIPGDGDLDLQSVLESVPQVPYALEIANLRLMAELGPETFCRQAREAAETLLKRCHFSPSS